MFFKRNQSFRPFRRRDFYLKSQVQVLKSAVIEEQNKNAKLQTEFHEKDSALRRLEDEFQQTVARNEALVKTIQQLQDSLDQSGYVQEKKKAKKKIEFKHSKTFDHTAIDNTLLEQELQRNLTENATLVSQIDELHRKHGNELHSATLRYEQAEEEKGKLQETIDLLKIRNEELMKQNDRLAVRQGKSPVNRIVSPLGCIAGLNMADELIRAHLDQSFVELETDELKSIVMDFLKRLKSIVTGWINLLTTLSNRSQLYPCDMSFEPLPASIEQYGQNLIHASESFTGLIAGIDRFAEKVVGCEDFRKFKEDVCELAAGFLSVLQECAGKVLPLFDLSIDAEARAQWCTAALDELNQKWRSNFVDLVSRFKSTLELLDASSIDDMTAGELVNSLEKLSNSASVVAECFVKKIFVENRIPTASKKLKCVNDCVQQSFQTISRHLIDIHMLSDHHKQLLERKLNSDLMHRLSLKISSNSTTPKPSPKAGNSMNPFSDDEEETEPETAETSTSAETDLTAYNNKEEEHRQRVVFYEAEISGAQKKLTELETEREQNQVDIALLKMKLEAAVKERDVDTSGCSTEHRCEPEKKLLKSHYKGRIADLTNQLQIVKSRANYYKNECDIILKHIEITCTERDRFRDESKSYQAKILELNDNLETVQANYAEQMGSMCDHLADMSARLADQSEQINSLKATPNEQMMVNGTKKTLKK
ncbi:hypothetical protein L596_012831 [Steinernema carpocapsae]|uniref:Protein phosphatase 1 regulatory subunit 21 n=1 Tax=Steinernema carpocapsae TaxID=34508 RepID=A0A4U5NZ24_STECR|nr:hypothetical protein L596_012831 [Steinernema carpocapsae]